MKQQVGLNIDIIKEIIRLGTKKNGSLTDPSESEFLIHSGIGPVTAHLEKLSLAGVIRDVKPVFGKNGGMWIGYTLSEMGIRCGNDPDFLEKMLSTWIEKPIHEVSQSVYDLVEVCKTNPIDPNYKQDFIRTLEEVAICFQHECYIATIALCGKILEVCLTDILKRCNIDTANIKMLGNLIRKVKDSVPTQYLDPSLESIALIISKSRNTAIHFNETIPIPSRDQAIMVIFATRDVVNRNILR
jgi:hypothetical protein